MRLVLAVAFFAAWTCPSLAFEPVGESASRGRFEEISRAGSQARQAPQRAAQPAPVPPYYPSARVVIVPRQSAPPPTPQASATKPKIAESQTAKPGRAIVVAPVLPPAPPLIPAWAAAPAKAQKPIIVVSLPPEPGLPMVPPAPQKPAITALPPSKPAVAEIAASALARVSDARRDPPVRVAIAPPAIVPDVPAQIVAPPPPSAALPPPANGRRQEDAKPGAPATADWKRAFSQALNEAEQAGIPSGAVADLRRFYNARGMRPLFTDGQGMARPGEATLDVVRQAETHGLDANRFAPMLAMAGRVTIAQKEVVLASLAIAYARDARGARINPSAISSLILHRPDLPDGEVVLNALANGEPAAALEGFNPQHAGYQALRKHLAAARASQAGVTKGVPLPVILPGPELAAGMIDPRVTALRQRFGLAEANDIIFDEDIAEELAGFQRKSGLAPTGVLDRRSVDALNAALPKPGNTPDPVKDIIVNLERWRWLPADLGETHVLVNIPQYSLVMREAGQVKLRAKVIVGEQETPTPTMSHRIDHMVINPSWTVPPNIARREYMPMLKNDPEELEEEGIQVRRTPSGVQFFQPPGDRNGLGRIKLVFPNQFTVHLHDTPDRELFGQDRRADSNGCVRVEDPFALAEAVLFGAQTKAQLLAMIGPREKRINLPVKVPVHLVYFTRVAGEDGTLAAHEDIYGHDRKMRALLGG